MMIRGHATVVAGDGAVPEVAGGRTKAARMRSVRVIVPPPLRLTHRSTGREDSIVASATSAEPKASAATNSLTPEPPAPGATRRRRRRRLAALGGTQDISLMTPKGLRDQILRLPPTERLELLDELWDSVAADASNVPVPEWHKQELDRRVAEPSPKPITSEE